MVEIIQRLTLLQEMMNFRNLQGHLQCRCASNPRYVKIEDVPEAEVNAEREILKAQALNEGKPEKVVEKMVEGRIESS